MCLTREGEGKERGLVTAKQLEVMPEMLAIFVSGKYLRKSAEIRAPENTPWSECVSEGMKDTPSAWEESANLVIAEVGHGHCVALSVRDLLQ